MFRNMLIKIFEKLKIWIKTKRKLEEKIKSLTKDLDKATRTIEKLKDKLDKDLQNKKIERLTISEEHSQRLKHELQTENANLRIENVELKSELRNIKAEINYKKIKGANQ